MLHKGCLKHLMHDEIKFNYGESKYLNQYGTSSSFVRLCKLIYHGRRG